MEEVITRYARLSRVEAVPRLADINARIEHVLQLAGLKLQDERARITFTQDLGPNIPPWPLDPELIDGAMENLIQNSMKAMPEGGSLVVRTRAHEEEFPTLTITLQDSGIGMDARHLQRAFEDFFTTHEEGSGLGLAFVRRVVEAHGGDIRLKSAISEGTLVTIELPYIPIDQGLQ